MKNCLFGIVAGISTMLILLTVGTLRSQESGEVADVERAMANALPLLHSKKTSGLFSSTLDSQLDLLPDESVLSQSQSYLQKSESEDGKRELLSYILVRFSSRSDGYDLVLDLLSKYPQTVRIRGQGLRWWLANCFGLHGMRLLIESVEKSPPGVIRIHLMEEVELVFGEWVETEGGSDYLKRCKEWLQRNWRDLVLRPSTDERPEGLLPSPNDQYTASPIRLRRTG